jgi:hypothetical protein
MIRQPVPGAKGGLGPNQTRPRIGVLCFAVGLLVAFVAAGPATAHPLVELILLTAKAGAKYGGKLAGPVEQLTTQVVRNKAVRDGLLAELTRTNPALGDELARGWSLAERSGMLDDITTFSVTRTYGPTAEALGAPTYRMEWATASQAASAIKREAKAARLADCTLGLSLGSLSAGTTLRSPAGCALIGGPAVGALGCELLDLECVERARAAYDRLLQAVASPAAEPGGDDASLSPSSVTP